MPDQIGLFAVLLIPVALLLFMTRNFGRRLRHPHDLLAEGGGPRIARFLFRALRSRYDLLFDAAVALVLSWALLDTGAALHPGGNDGAKRAVVLDCSRSMFAGEPGFRPVDVALEAISLRPALAVADRYALVYDAGKRKSRLLPWRSVVAEGGTDTASARANAAARLLAASSLFSVDYTALEALPARGYGDIVLVTDSFPMQARGFSLLETGFAGSRRGIDEGPPGGSIGGTVTVDDRAPSIWPASLRYDRTENAWIASFVEAGRRTLLSIEAFDASTGRFEELASARYSVGESRDGRRVSVRATGAVRFVFADPAGGIPSVFDAILAPSETAAFASGPFSELVLNALPYLVVRPRPALALVDAGREGDARRVGAEKMLSTALVERAPLLADPGVLGGRPLAEGSAAGVDFAWGPASLANPDLPLAYDAAIREAAAPPFRTAFRSGGKVRSAGGGAWLVAEGKNIVAVDAPISEYFEPAKSGVLELSRPPRLGLAAAILALLTIAKFAAWRLFSPARQEESHAAKRAER